MHSRIIELSKDPILKHERMCESSVPDWFYHSIADYTDADTDRDHDIKWFLDAVARVVDVAEDGKSFTFKPKAKQKYFERQYHAFLDKACELTGISLDAFVGEAKYDIGMAMYKLNEHYQDKFSLYVYFNDELKSLDEWIRETDLSGSFYFGGIPGLSLLRGAPSIMELFHLKTPYLDCPQCFFYNSRALSGTPYIGIAKQEPEGAEPLMDVTANLSDEVPLGCIAVKDYSENTGLLAFLKSIGFITEVVEKRRSGYVEIPICRYDKAGPGEILQDSREVRYGNKYRFHRRDPHHTLR